MADGPPRCRNRLDLREDSSSKPSSKDNWYCWLWSCPSDHASWRSDPSVRRTARRSRSAEQWPRQYFRAPSIWERRPSCTRSSRPRPLELLQPSCSWLVLPELFHMDRKLPSPIAPWFWPQSMCLLLTVERFGWVVPPSFARRLQRGPAVFLIHYLIWIHPVSTTIPTCFYRIC